MLTSPIISFSVNFIIYAIFDEDLGQDLSAGYHGSIHLSFYKYLRKTHIYINSVKSKNRTNFISSSSKQARCHPSKASCQEQYDLVVQNKAFSLCHSPRSMGLIIKITVVRDTRGKLQSYVAKVLYHREKVQRVFKKSPSLEISPLKTFLILWKSPHFVRKVQENRGNVPKVLVRKVLKVSVNIFIIVIIIIVIMEVGPFNIELQLR